MQWLADRFFNGGSDWTDAATGASVRIRFVDPGGTRALDWDEECAKLAALRHPLLNALVDYGEAGDGRLFEAYAHGDDVPVPPARTEQALDSAIRFVRQAGVTLDAARCRLAMRPVRAGRPGTFRPVGVRLQRRPALSLIEEALEGNPVARGDGPGTVVVTVAGTTGAGLRTLRGCAARAARLRGFVPLDPGLLPRYPELRSAVSGRHLCLMLDGDAAAPSRAAAASLLSELSGSSARRHLMLQFLRQPERSRDAVWLGPMPLRALVGMVFADPCGGPTEEELFAHARTAGGLPGIFVGSLTGSVRPVAVVHEARAEYGVDEPGPVRPPVEAAGRILGAALGARARANGLARKGRHAAALRLLQRASRVLEGRGHHDAAASCVADRAWLLLERGRCAAAREDFTRARGMAASPAVKISCAAGEGTAFVDEGRLVEAEAAFRGAGAAAVAIGDAQLRALADAGLARTLFWRGDHERAASAASAASAAETAAATRARALAIRARALARSGRTPDAIAAAREARAAAPSGNDSRLDASIELALADVLALGGDDEGARQALGRAERIAHAAHLPLWRCRASLLAAAGREDKARERLARLARRFDLPPLLSSRVEAALSREAPARVEAVGEVETLLALSQRSQDERSALGAILGAVAARLHTASLAAVAHDERVLACDGRTPGDLPVVAREALASGQRVAHLESEPRQVAEPVRYGGSVIGVICCRWAPGAAVEDALVQPVLRAAALSAAAPVRALLDVAMPAAPAAWSDLIGESPAASELRTAVTRAARAPFAVLVEGESGAGKELVARAIHRLSPRRDRRFCALNCAALTDELIEAELFGHARGAFTGAAAERAGIFEEADGGTVFLDEVGELSARAQAKLLRVIQEGEVRRVGENLPRRVDVRVVAATNRRLEDEVTAGRFRADLRFRLDVVRIVVPPLRERASDIPLLAAHFWRDASARVGSQATLSADALAALARYDWPGNVRELQNAIAWMAVHSPKRGRIGASAVPRHVAHAAPASAGTLEAAREEFERRFVRAALATASGQRARAAASLGVSRQGLAKIMRRLRIDM